MAFLAKAVDILAEDFFLNGMARSRHEEMAVSAPHILKTVGVFLQHPLNGSQKENQKKEYQNLLIHAAV